MPTPPPYQRSSPLVQSLRRWVDPVMTQAGFAWNESGLVVGRDGRVEAVLYEARPLDFMRRYPHSDLQASYGDDWPPPCVDLWLKFHHQPGRVEIDLEGLDVEDELSSAGQQGLAARATRLTDDPDQDGRMIAAALAVALQVAGPDAAAD